MTPTTTATSLPARAAAGEKEAASDRMQTVNRNGPGGLGAVPRKLSPGESFRGLDANATTPIALTIFLLNLASDEAAAGVQPG